MRFFLFTIMLCCLPSFAYAESHDFSNGEAVSLQLDQAYILVRAFQRQGLGIFHRTVIDTPVLIRTLSDAELNAAKAAANADPKNWMDSIETNIVEPATDKPYAVVNGEGYLLVAVKPGTYVLYGSALGKLMSSSLSMGTVKFEAKSGMITDMGTIVAAYDDVPTDIPELSKIVTGYRISDEFRPLMLALRPSAMDVPPSLQALPRIPADYRAVAPFPNYAGARLSRLAPLPGVLDYDKDGNVIDLKAGGAVLH